ncbi:rCG30542 [Rattus norvegicus]|uniref:RCG30542 n=1 Tax=Rattus norvegicus TaxID=10116 RepID=A6KN14_RAT|nr:rCG30542 [Rattus norvegicus]
MVLFAECLLHVQEALGSRSSTAGNQAGWCRPVTRK